METLFDEPYRAGYPFEDMLVNHILVTVSLLLFATTASAQRIAFVTPGDAPSSQARRAVLRCHTILDAQEGLVTIPSRELRRALAGLPAPAIEGQPEDDPLEDVRRLVQRAEGERLRQSLSRLGDRVGVELLVTVRQVGGELELRAFNVERAAFYRGTLMIPAAAPPDADELIDFVRPRAAALTAAAPGEAEQAQPRRRRSRWWIWAIVGGAVAAAALVGYLVQPDEVEDGGVILRITAP
jgi:hypothetical protein